jgi:hypothetical protein
MDEQALNEKYSGRMVYREGDRIIVKIPVRFRRRNGRQMIFAEGEGGASNSKSEDNALALAIARAWKWQEELESGEYSSVEELASAKKIDVSYARRMFRLNSLAPDVVEAILQNDAPDHLSLRSLYRGIALSWAEQRRQLLG